jgi:hypothetical protein
MIRYKIIILCSLTLVFILCTSVNNKPTKILLVGDSFFSRINLNEKIEKVLQSKTNQVYIIDTLFADGTSICMHAVKQQLKNSTDTNLYDIIILEGVDNYRPWDYDSCTMPAINYFSAKLRDTSSKIFITRWTTRDKFPAIRCSRSNMTLKCREFPTRLASDIFLDSCYNDLMAKNQAVSVINIGKQCNYIPANKRYADEWDHPSDIFGDCAAKEIAKQILTKVK